ILAASDATHAIGDERHLPHLDAARRARRPALRILSLDPSATLPSWRQAMEAGDDAWRGSPHTHPGDLAVLLFTSGTTGHAKGVMLSHSTLLSNVESVARTFEFGPTDRFLSILPLHHAFESTAGFLCPLRVGASICTARGLASRELREDMQSSGATIFIGVPLLYEKLMAAIDKGIADAPAGPRLLVRTLRGLSRAVRRTTGIRLGRALLPPPRNRAR